MTDDHELDRLLRDAAQTYNTPEEPPLDRMWSVVQAASFPVQRRTFSWPVLGGAIAASLLIGTFAGRVSVGATVQPSNTRTTATEVAAGSPVQPAGEDHHAMGELLGRTAVLLAALPGEGKSTTVEHAVSREGVELLTSTRLLLDSPMGTDPRMRALLQDLELVLVQVARIEPKRRQDDMAYIQAALTEHDIVPRLRTAVAEISLDDF